MGLLGYAVTDVDAMASQDEQVAAEFDARRAEVLGVTRSA